MPSSSERERIARNFVRRYGTEKFRRLLDAIAGGESGQAIATEFEVSRERVRQWKNAFGTILTFYQVHPDIQKIANEG